jgi:hypothetical protein
MMVLEKKMSLPIVPIWRILMDRIRLPEVQSQIAGSVGKKKKG